MDEPSFTWPGLASDETFFDLEITFAQAPNAQQRATIAQALAEAESGGAISVRPIGLRVGWHDTVMRVQLADERRPFESAEAATRSLIRSIHAAAPVTEVQDVAVATLPFEADPAFDESFRQARVARREASAAADSEATGLRIEPLKDGVPPSAQTLASGEVDTPRGRCRCGDGRLEWHHDGEVFGLRFPKPNLRNLVGLQDGAVVVVFLGGADFTVLACRSDAVVMVGVCPSGAVVPDYHAPLRTDAGRLIVARDEDDFPDEAVELLGLDAAVEEALANAAPLEDNGWVDLDGAFQIDLPL